MRVRIIRNDAEPHYDQYIGNEYEVIRFNEDFNHYWLPTKNIQGLDESVWFETEVEIIEED